MLIEITSSGGFGGLSTNQKTVINTEQMEAGEKTTVCDTFAIENLEKLEDKGENVKAADMFTYDIVVTEDDGSKRTFSLPESVIPADVLDMIDSYK